MPSCSAIDLNEIRPSSMISSWIWYIISGVVGLRTYQHPGVLLYKHQVKNKMRFRIFRANIEIQVPLLWNDSFCKGTKNCVNYYFKKKALLKMASTPAYKWPVLLHTSCISWEDFKFHTNWSFTFHGKIL
jgi:hypothetical protein